jgi:hypothetical protein
MSQGVGSMALNAESEIWFDFSPDEDEGDNGSFAAARILKWESDDTPCKSVTTCSCRESDVI